ncbi:MAG: cytochrome c3 family protein [Anaerolineales bacterium]|nr:MAG: cytochrome c3 family protein [Anaerolineales bacterium]
MAPLEPWEKAIVDAEKFLQTEHGKMTCIECHAGVNVSVKDEAHVDLIAAPSEQSDIYCAECHEEQVAVYPNALHNTQTGYWTTINARNGNVPEDHPALNEMFGNHCASCHTSCGECHVSQPKNVGGGLFSGHVFEKTPPMTRSCTACHGSRVGNEYLGKNEGFPGDVHFREARMNCVKCHTGEALHGDPSIAPDHRLSGAEDPKCSDCHADAASGADGIEMHTYHGDGTTISCQVCHSISYTSCDGCHVAISEKTGNPFFETQATYMTFFIGKNPIQSEDRPYRYVPVRHVPIAPTSYQFYGENLLSNFDALPTWVYATPHNIQRNTPQNASCEACHGNPDIFLTADKVKESELSANLKVIVQALPARLDLIFAAMPQPADHADLASTACMACHADGIRNAPVFPQNHVEFNNDSCSGCHKLP